MGKQRQGERRDGAGGLSPAGTPERRRHRQCPSCGGTSMIRGCRVPGVQLQVVAPDGERRSDLIGLYSDVCVDCGLTSFYARRAEVAEQLDRLRAGAALAGDGSRENQGEASG